MPQKDRYEGTDIDLPSGMDAQPDVGDIEEQMQMMLPKIDVQERMPDAVDDRGKLDAIDAEDRRSVREIERTTEMGAERARQNASAKPELDDPAMDPDIRDAVDRALDISLPDL